MKTERLLFISDVHIGWKLYNIPELAEDAKLLFSKAIDLAIQLKVTALVVAGDLYDTQSPSEEAVRFVTEQRQRLQEAGIEAVGISGDHDKRPGVSTTWIGDVNGFSRTTKSGSVLGVDYKNFLDAPKYIEHTNTENTEWIVLHGQEETMFKFVEDKKRLNLKGLNITKLPKLRGVILGDIHKPMSSVLAFPEHNREISVHYCGSLGVIKSDEIGTKTGLLYWDGSKLSRQQLPSHRTYAKFTFPDDAHLLPAFVKNIAKETYKPLVVVSYPDTLEKEHLDSLKQLETITHLRRSKVVMKNDVEEVVNIRAELKTEDKINAVIDVLFKDDAETKQLFINMLSGVDPKNVLDVFKANTLNTTSG